MIYKHRHKVMYARAKFSIVCICTSRLRCLLFFFLIENKAEWNKKIHIRVWYINKDSTAININEEKPSIKQFKSWRVCYKIHERLTNKWQNEKKSFVLFYE